MKNLYLSLNLLLLVSPTILLAQMDFDATSDLKLVHNENVTIHNSLCVGFDCLDSESYGSDTQRFKENNLRVHFDDTSVGAFPANDWRIEINSNASGGDSYFAIQDVTAGRDVFKIFAGARSNALIVDSQGDLGLGTASPSTDIHVKVGDTPALRLEQDASSGFAPQTWDIAGNETSFFIRDATNGSTLPFRVFPNAPSNSLVIEAGGNVGIGLTNPESKLHVDGDIGKTGAIVGVSDRRIKSNIKPILNASALLLLLDGKSFEYDLDSFNDMGLPEGPQYGLIAQDVEKVLPFLVHEDFIQVERNGENYHLKGIEYEQLIPLLINALKEQNHLIESLNKENKDILARLEILEKLLSGE